MAAPAVAGAARAGVLVWKHRRALLWLLALLIAISLAVALIVIITITASGGGGPGQFTPSAFALTLSFALDGCACPQIRRFQ